MRPARRDIDHEHLFEMIEAGEIDSNNTIRFGRLYGQTFASVLGEGKENITRMINLLERLPVDEVIVDIGKSGNSFTGVPKEVIRQLRQKYLKED